MEAFLKESKRKLATLSDETKVHVVLGNESCDLDSAVSALVYAFYLHSKSKTQDDNVVYIPVLNIPHQDYTLRTEVTHCLRANHIEDDNIVFHDQIDWRTLHDNSKLILTLVDHNVLVKTDDFLDSDIVEIVDHHVNGRHDDEDRLLEITLETVGSCSTLVAEKILHDCKDILDETVTTLLLSTILIDTFNLSETAQKKTAKDEAVVAELHEICSNIDTQKLFDSIEKVKFDVSGLSTSDLLRKDYKSVLGTNLNIGLSSITLHLKDILKRPSLEEDLKNFCSDKNLHALLLINLARVDDDTPQRQLGIYSPSNKALKDDLVKSLQEADSPCLQLSCMENAPTYVAAFDQGNVGASRKKIMPIAQQLLEIADKDPKYLGNNSDLLVGDLLSDTQVVMDSPSTDTQLVMESPSTSQNNSNDDDPFGLGSLSSPSPVTSSTSEQDASNLDPFGVLDSQNTSNNNLMPESSNSTLLDLDPFGGMTSTDSKAASPSSPGLLDLNGFDGLSSLPISSTDANLLPDLSDLSNTDSTLQPPSLLDLAPFGEMVDSASGSSNVASDLSNTDSTLQPPSLLDLAPFGEMVDSASGSSNIASDLSNTDSTLQPPSLLDLDPFGGMVDSTSGSSNLASPFEVTPATSELSEPMTLSPSSPSSNPVGDTTDDLLGLDPFSSPQLTNQTVSPTSPFLDENTDTLTTAGIPNDNDFLGLSDFTEPVVTQNLDNNVTENAQNMDDTLTTSGGTANDNDFLGLGDFTEPAVTQSLDNNVTESAQNTDDTLTTSGGTANDNYFLGLGDFTEPIVTQNLDNNETQSAPNMEDIFGLSNTQTVQSSQASQDDAFGAPLIGTNIGSSDNQNSNDLFNLDLNKSDEPSHTVDNEFNVNDVNESKSDTHHEKSAEDPVDLFGLSVSANGNAENQSKPELNDSESDTNLEKPTEDPVDLLGLSISTNGNVEDQSKPDLLDVDEEKDVFVNDESAIGVPKVMKDIPKTPCNSVTDFASLSHFNSQELDSKALSDKVQELHRNSIPDVDAEVIVINGDSSSQTSFPREDSSSPSGVGSSGIPLEDVSDSSSPSSGGMGSSVTPSEEISDSSSGESYTVNDVNRGPDQFAITQIVEEDGQSDGSKASIENIPEDIKAEVEDYVNNVVQMSSFLYKQERIMSSDEEEADEAEKDVTLEPVDVKDLVQETSNDNEVSGVEDVPAKIENENELNDLERVNGDSEEVQKIEDVERSEEIVVESQVEAVVEKEEEILSESSNQIINYANDNGADLENTNNDFTYSEYANENNIDSKHANENDANEDGADVVYANEEGAKIDDEKVTDANSEQNIADGNGHETPSDTQELDENVIEEVSDYVNDVVQMASFAYKQEAVETEMLVSEQENNTDKDIDVENANFDQSEERLVENDEDGSKQLTNENQDIAEQKLSAESDDLIGIIEPSPVIEESCEVIDAEELHAAVSEFKDVTMETVLDEKHQNVCENEQDREDSVIDSTIGVTVEGDSRTDHIAKGEDTENKIEDSGKFETDLIAKGEDIENKSEESSEFETDHIAKGEDTETKTEETSDFETDHIAKGEDTENTSEESSEFENAKENEDIDNSTKEDLNIDADDIQSFVDSVVRGACFIYEEERQRQLGDEDTPQQMEETESSLQTDPLTLSEDDMNLFTDDINQVTDDMNQVTDDINQVTVTITTPTPTETKPSDAIILGNSGIVEETVVASQEEITEAMIAPSEESVTESAISASDVVADETVSPTEGSVVETKASESDKTAPVDNASGDEQNEEKMEASLDETRPSQIPNGTPRPGTLQLSGSPSTSRGGKTKIQPVYVKPKNQAGTPASLLSEDGSITSVTTLDAVSMFPISPSPGSISDTDDDLSADQPDRKQDSTLNSHSSPKRLVSVDSAMAEDIHGDWSGEAAILEKAAQRQRQKQLDSNENPAPRLSDIGRELSLASAEAKQRMEGVQIPEEWQDDEIYEFHGNAEDDFYKRSVPKMDSIMENGQIHKVDGGTITDSVEETTDKKQRLRVDSDLKRLRDNSMTSLGADRGREDSELSDATLDKFAAQMRRMSEDSLEDDIKYLEEEGELDMSEEDDDTGVGARPKKKIPAELNLDQIDPDLSASTNGATSAVLTPTSTEMSWDDDGGTGQQPEAIPEYTAKEEMEDKKNWRRVMIGGHEHAVDMRAITPYKKVLSHGGYYGDGLNAIIVFASCYMPDKSRKDYNYVMHNLFLYVVSTLELLVAQDYMIIYFHGAAPKSKIPSLGWMRKCYKMIDRKLRKNLKGLFLVHPTTWLKTVVRLTRPFVSSKFSNKLKFIYTLEDLGKQVPMDFVYVPDEVRRHDERIKRKENGRHWWGWLGYTNTLSDEDFDFEDEDGSELSSIDDLDDLLFPQLPPEKSKYHPGDFDFPSSPHSATTDEGDMGAESSDSGCSDHEDHHHEAVEGGGFMEDDIFAYSDGNVTPVNRTPRPSFVITSRRKQTREGNRTPTNENDLNNANENGIVDSNENEVATEVTS